MQLLFLLVILERSVARRPSPFPFSLLHSLPPCLLSSPSWSGLAPTRLETNQTQINGWLIISIVDLTLFQLQMGLYFGGSGFRKGL